MPQHEGLKYTTLLIAFLTFIKIGLLSPIIEEFSFRFGLFSKRKYQIISILIFAVPFFYQAEIQFFKSSFYYFYSILLLHALSLYFIPKQKYFLLIIVNSVLFGLIHMLNFASLSKENIIIALVNIVPQILAGYFLANLKYKKGFTYSVFLHITLNSIVFFINLAMSYGQK